MLELGFDFHAMATPCSVRLQGGDEPLLRRAAQAAIEEVQRIEARFSRYRGDGIVMRITAAAGGAAVTIDAETEHLLDFADSLHRISGGRFDITSGVLRQAWDLRRGTVPDAAQVSALLARMGASRIQRTPGQVTLAAGMEIDLGGIGKEYACDRAAQILLHHGVAHGFVELGGDIRVLGPRADGTPWVFGIRHPRQEQALLASVALAGGALATSGDGERFILHEGRRYGHLLDARSGWPVTGWASISVVAPTCSAAGAACTLACLMEAEAPAFLHAQRVAWLALDHHGVVHRSVVGADPFGAEALSSATSGARS